MADPNLIEWLRQLRGIEREYFDYRGQHRRVPDEIVERILSAFGHEIEDNAALLRDAQHLSEKNWRRVLPPVSIIRPTRSRVVCFSVLRPLLPAINWQIQQEDGQVLEGSTDPASLPVVEEKRVEELHYCRLALELPQGIPLGYHRLRLLDTEGHLLGESSLIVVPERCYEPDEMSEGARLWGLAVQLYTVRSRRNWGIGDFTDLAEISRHAGPMGIDVIGLNPLHALFPSDPSLHSPYSPASRQFLNPIYIDPETVPEYADCEEAQDRVREDGFQSRLAELRQTNHVDYAGVAELKDEILWHLFRQLEDGGDDVRRSEFERFIESSGKPLRLLCLYYALQAHFTSSGRPGGWQAWPTAYDRPGTDTVAAFAAGHGETIRYHMYLQWLARRQLEQAERAATDAGLSIGLYRDLAVGVNSGGAEAWADRELYSQMATIGAPPDPLALQGQDWGIPPMRPDILRERAYRPFIDLLRANMGHGGALRIDHVMVLYRLWWVPQGRPSSDGTYVYYDLDALMGILALESQRHRCLVIGEDLGTVPDAIRHAMPDYGVYSYRVFYFEHDEDGAPRRPENYPDQALVTVSTHDLPPLASFWSGSDIGLRRDLDLYPDQSMIEETVAGRLRQRQLITTMLGGRGFYSGSGDDPDGQGGSIDPLLAEAIQFYLASSRARLMVLQPEDWLGMETPVNVPGTSDEYPNWSRKLTQDLEDWLVREDIRSLARRITSTRQQQP